MQNAKARRLDDAGASWDERCAVLFEDLRMPARAMVSRAYRHLAAEAIDDIYAAAWTSSLSALRGRGSDFDDEELRRYVLAAVANHASKEMRRRSRRPASSLESDPGLDPIDADQVTTEERVLDREAGSIARDLLSSLPERRRTVMLMRFGWGLKPKEVCALVDGLSIRAYRKEINRGVDDLIERLAALEDGEWCRSRRALLREHIAGTADVDVDRQAREHLSHCRHCAKLVRSLDADLKALDGVGLIGVAGLAGAERLSPLGRLSDLADRTRDGIADLLGRSGAQVSEAAGSLAAGGGTRGAGTAGAGALAKLAGLGLAGKATVACVGAGAAATACVAAGILPAPVLSLGGGGDDETRPARIEAVKAEVLPRLSLIDSEVIPDPGLDDYAPLPPAPSPAPTPEPAPDPKLPPSPQPAPTPAPSPVAQEFDPLAQSAPTAASAPSPTPTSSGGGSAGSPAQQEFGP